MFLVIYEMFLRNENKEVGKCFGVFYMLLFFVDYVFDCVEEVILLNVDICVFDLVVGFGVFFVGVYWWIVEFVFMVGEVYFLFDYFYMLMMERIFGVELNVIVCYVVVFSLYLMMFDYVELKEVVDYVWWLVWVGCW